MDSNGNCNALFLKISKNRYYAWNSIKRERNMQKAMLEIKKIRSAHLTRYDRLTKGNSNGKAANTVIDDFIAAGNLRIYPKCHAVNIRKKPVMRQ